MHGVDDKDGVSAQCTVLIIKIEYQRNARC
jgi:hypothetical protein